MLQEEGDVEQGDEAVRKGEDMWQIHMFALRWSWGRNLGGACKVLETNGKNSKVGFIRDIEWPDRGRVS
jgi:hypothetical protein